jgi:homoserine kinase type II
VLLQSEMAYQNHVATLSTYDALPQGAIHADLFRDNVLFDSASGDAENATLTGFFDFYFAGVDAWVFDIAVCMNDWCIDLSTGATDIHRTATFLAAYEAVRPLTAQERELLPAMVRAAALRFWISRLWDWHLPREASMLKPHDPGHFERVLRQRVAHPLTLSSLQSISV